MTVIDVTERQTAVVRRPVVHVPGFDRLLEFEPGVRAVGLRNVPGTLSFFATHFPRQPILPGVLLLESMAALAAEAAGGRVRLLSATALRFRHFIGPGDQVTITVELAERTGAISRWRADASVDGRKVATARTLTLGPSPRPISADTIGISTVSADASGAAS